MDFVANYLAIEQIRFGDRLTVRQHIAPDVLDAAVPVMLLQPLAENAIRHGIAKHRAPGTIEIEARAADGRLRLTVRDNGPGIPPNQDDLHENGVGLRNTRQRLQQLYGEAHRFELIEAPGGGLQVNIEIPLRDADRTGLDDQESAA